MKLAELDRLDPQVLRQLRLVLPNLTDHRLSRLTTESLVELLVLLEIVRDLEPWCLGADVDVLGRSYRRGVH